MKISDFIEKLNQGRTNKMFVISPSWSEGASWWTDGRLCPQVLWRWSLKKNKQVIKECQYNKSFHITAVNIAPFFVFTVEVQEFGMKCSDFWVNYPLKFRPTGCGGTSIGEEIWGRYNLRLLFRDVRPNEEEEAAASEWPLTRLIIFLAADQTKRNNLRMNLLKTV